VRRRTECGGHRKPARILCVFALCAAMATHAGENLPFVESQVKAAFLYNFAQFVEWPRETFRNSSDPINLCILGLTPVGRTLQNVVRDKVVGGRTLAVHNITNVGQAGNCQILFVSASEQKQLHAILDATKTSDVLTVGETENFAAEGGVVGFHRDDGRIRFDLNLQAAQRERLRVSSKLASLAISILTVGK